MATAPNKVTVILVRGLFGMIWSRGMDTLAGKLKAAGYNTQVWNHSWFFLAWFAYKEEIAAEVARLTKAGQTVVLVGHSFGANVLLMAARLIPTTRIPLLLAVDPAQQYDCSVSSNVQTAYGFRNTVGGLGQGALRPRAGVFDIPVRQTHGYMDDEPSVQNRVIAEIAKL